MKLRELLYICSDLLCLEYSENSFSADRSPDLTQKKLVNCFRFAYEELYRDYAVSLRRTVVEAKDGTVDLSAYNLNKVVSLVDAEGNDVKFRYGDNRLLLDKEGTYNLCYSRLPDNVEWNDEVVMPSPAVSERLLAYGVVREFLASLNDWQGAKAWDDRFKNGLQAALSKTASLHMPQRRWL